MSRLSARPQSASSSRQSAEAGEMRCEQVERLPHPQPVRQFRFLELTADHAAQRRPVGLGVDAEDPHRSRIGLAQGLDALDGGGLARTVRAEDPEDLAGRDLERHAVDGGGVAVALAQPVDDQGVLHAIEPRFAYRSGSFELRQFREFGRGTPPSNLPGPSGQRKRKIVAMHIRGSRGTADAMRAMRASERARLRSG